MKVEVCIIGGGIVGLACAAESALHGFSTLLVERHASFGQETSSRNSEVIHSGIYYPTNSLKARLCVRGNQSLYGECERAGVWMKRCGKLIVAVTPEEEAPLQTLYNRGIANGVEGLRILDARDASKLEPNVKCYAALYSPNTGIVDSHQLMKSYYLQARSNGADIALGVEYIGREKDNSIFHLKLKDTNGEIVNIDSRCVINSAGLQSDKVAETFGIDIDDAGYRLHHNRGHYYSVSSAKSWLISHLVYPLPHENLVSVGIHMTIDKAGRIKLGPDMEYLDFCMPELDWYKFDNSRREKFYTAVHRYFPVLDIEDLSPDQVGVRPKLKGSEETIKDFIIKEESDRGLPGLVNLIGIESPGLTCAREIAREVLRILQ